MKKKKGTFFVYYYPVKGKEVLVDRYLSHDEANKVSDEVLAKMEKEIYYVAVADISDKEVAKLMKQKGFI